MRFPYYEELKIVHLFDTMHIRKNVIETLWRIIDGRRDKEKIVKICNNIQESNHAMQSVIRSNSDGDQNNLPWLLTEQQSNGVKEVIQRIKFPTGFCSNIKNILTKKGEFGGVKTHDWHTFINVINNFSIHIYILVTYIYLDFFWSSFETSNDSFLLLQYVLPLSLPNDFDNNAK
jgi:hypothetical protein